MFRGVLRPVFVQYSLLHSCVVPRWTTHAGHCWRSKDKLINEVLLWTPSHGHTSVSWSARTYLHWFCVDTGSNLDDLPGVMDDRDRWRKSQENLYIQYNLMMMMMRYIYIPGWVKSFAIFWLCEAQFSSSWCFCWGHEGDEPHWTVRCQACLILSKCYSPDFPLSYLPTPPLR